MRSPEIAQELMFTGIVSDIGEVVKRDDEGDTSLEIACSYPSRSIAIGASISCAGICLTVVSTRDLADGRAAFSVQASKETRTRTTLESWHGGTRINLERALRAGDELGGHIVSGHVDAVAKVLKIVPEAGSRRIKFAVPKQLSRFIAAKGSICLDGTSFTVNEVEADAFFVNVIPHTLSVTTWGATREGEGVNLEIDMLARYVARLAEQESK